MTFDHGEFLRTNTGDVLLFVYGTLRHDASPSNSHLVDACGGRLVATGCTVFGVLHDFGAFPGMVLDDNAGRVTGEVWQVPVTRFGPLNRYEGPLYRRQCVRVHTQGGDSFAADAYVLRDEAGAFAVRTIKGGDWVTRSSEGGTR